ncbi:MAG: Serine-tRNA ligase [Candidatus Uhrbacteria bacterium GW2011_GWF2_41_16]|uniref:Serine--tRNA ligase n=2 Tax=Candidatus Uhriibacteriota TaxID=1752732 RepID=A0A0G0YCX9_9BACT|nr:MAG: Serine-tRNA ligase [Candidatus Uhrbacteria bacterium GW2011_GWA2_41_10]KKR87254.1 MAG: Serine-tRNA ligase [Candidatus Uhrbacteria bacterium GW2011_GWC2_41_11]KKR98172.1 MAG: Serine-tRNA ligase [Candidatus Uhrbacteria bacterium GW2011_GWF2_41_16]
MIDLKYLLQHPDVIEENNRRRSADIDIHIVQTLAEERTKAVQRVDDVRRRIHESAETVRQASAEIRDALIAEGRALKEEARAAEETLLQMETDLERELKKYPNLLREDVKIGKDSDDNEILRLVNEPRVFDFPIQDHVAIGERLGIIDIERAGKVSGSRFVYLKGDLVLMEFALIQYILSVVIPEKFTPVLPPHIISIKSMAGMGYLEHGGEEEIYHLKHDDAVLIGTSEQSIGPMHMDEILPLESLPLRYVGFSPCYRREAGSHGKDVRGILRMHQFDKVEMFSFTTPEHSDEEHELLLSLEERLMKGLQLPYRVLRLCSGDIGRPSARTYDIETWIPSQNQYRETHSTSNTTDYQTRRLRIRYKTVDGKNELAHALNGTAFAIGRILIAILENYQQADGSVLIPEVLRPWIGKEKIG